MNSTLRQSILFLLLLTTKIQAQNTITVTEKAVLPSILTEASGVEINGDSRNKIWSFNDSGNLPQLYEFDSTGKLTRTLDINATNVDWEEMTVDSLGNFYVCDFGNNNNDRKDLVIYKIINPDSIVGTSVTPTEIHFTYPDQHAFPPSNALMNFDMEACIHYEGALFLFSKNRTDPYSGYSKLYRLPDVPGTYVAELLDSFYSGPGPLNLSSITSADISPDLKTLVLISHEMLFLFTNFTGHNFFKGTEQDFVMSGEATHKEGVCFTSNTDLYITDERSGHDDTTGGKLYTCDIRQYLSVATGITPVEENSIRIYPNPFKGKVTVKNMGVVPVDSIMVLNEVGEEVVLKTHPENQQTINLSKFPKGIYTIQVSSGNGRITREVIMQ